MLPLEVLRDRLIFNYGFTVLSIVVAFIFFVRRRDNFLSTFVEEHFSVSRSLALSINLGLLLESSNFFENPFFLAINFFKVSYRLFKVFYTCINRSRNSFGSPYQS